MMGSDSNSSPLNTLTWEFDQIAASNIARATALEEAGSADALLQALKIALEAALGTKGWSALRTRTSRRQVE